MSQAWPCRVSAHARPCRSACSTVSRAVLSCALARCCSSYHMPPRPCRALYRDTTPCRRPFPVTIQNLYRYPIPCHACTARRVAACSAVSWSIVVSYRSPGCAILRHNGHPSATIQCFVSRLPLVIRTTVG